LVLAEERLRLATEAADIGWWDVEEGHGQLSWPPRVEQTARRRSMRARGSLMARLRAS
jgi:hypothetical protein